MQNPVFLLTIDSLRADRLDETRFPQSHSTLETDFTTYTNAYSHGVATPLAFPGLVSGTPVQDDGTLPQTPTIGELCPGRAAAVPNNIHLSSARGYDRGFDYFGGESTNTGFVQRLKDFGRQSAIITQAYRHTIHFVRNITADSYPTPPYAPADEITRQLKKLANSGSYQLIWGHYMDPHFPFTPAAILDRDISIDATPGEVRKFNDNFSSDGTTERGLSILKNLYDENIRYLDRELATVLTHLKEIEVYDDALIIIVADHGEAFGEDGLQSHPWDCDPIDALTQTPLLVKYPNGMQAGERQSHLVQHIDVFETIKAYFAGRDVTKALASNRERAVLSKSNNSIRVTTTDGYAFIRRDTREEVLGCVLKQALQKARDEPYPNVPLSTGDIPGVAKADRDDVEERLKALGYK